MLDRMKKTAKEYYDIEVKDPIEELQRLFRGEEGFKFVVRKLARLFDSTDYKYFSFAEACFVVYMWLTQDLYWNSYAECWQEKEDD